MSKKARRAGRTSVLMAAAAVALSGCSLEVFNPGAITDESLNDISLMPIVVAGVANEFNNMMDRMILDNSRLTDDLAGTGSYFETGRLRRGAVEWDEVNGNWGQFHEAIWTADEAWDRMSVVMEGAETSSTLGARLHTLKGHAQRMFGENFCQVTYDAGPVQDRTTAFDSAIASFNLALTVAAAAGSDADDFRDAARAGLAMAYAAKGDFGTAITHSVQVATGFELQSHMNRNAQDNEVYFETFQRAEMGVYGTYTWLLDEAGAPDARTPFTVCGTFDDPADPKNSNVTATGLCTSHQGADGVTAHYRQEKFDDWGSDVTFASGVNMRLLEAEEALGRADWTTFLDRVNEVRNELGEADHDVDLATLTARGAGALEYPNACDDTADAACDGWSILDSERYLTNWLDSSRIWDLHRWNHPFLDGGIVFWDSEPRRASCYPIAEIECTLNETIQGSTLLTGVGAGTQVCG